MEELKKEKRRNTQLTFAFELLGPKGVPYLLKLYESADGFDEELFYTINSIFGELEDKAASAVDPLMEIASNKSKPEEFRVFAVLALGEIGSSAERSIPLLQELAENNGLKYSTRLHIVQWGNLRGK